MYLVILFTEMFFFHVSFLFPCYYPPRHAPRTMPSVRRSLVRPMVARILGGDTEYIHTEYDFLITRCIYCMNEIAVASYVGNNIRYART